MGKLLILSLDESENNLYSKIMKIVNEAGISTDIRTGQEQQVISIGELTILPAQRKVLKRGREVTLTNIEFRILRYSLIKEKMTCNLFLISLICYHLTALGAVSYKSTIG